MLLQPGAGGEAGWVRGIKKTKGSPESMKGSDVAEQVSLEGALLHELSNTWKCQKWKNVDQSGDGKNLKIHLLSITGA